MSTQQTKWPIKGVRVDGDQVVISVKGGNNAARWLCGEILLLKEATPQPAAEKGAGWFADRSIATHSLTLWERPEGGMTSAAQLLIRPRDWRCDESGEHPGEHFVMVTITREEMRTMLAELDADWEETVRLCGDPNQAQGAAADDANKDAEAATAEIMSQAQVFASAWSLVGGRFDSGTALDDANEAKDELRVMVKSLAALAAAPQPRGYQIGVDVGGLPDMTSLTMMPWWADRKTDAKAAVRNIGNPSAGDLDPELLSLAEKAIRAKIAKDKAD